MGSLQPCGIMDIVTSGLSRALPTLLVLALGVALLLAASRLLLGRRSDLGLGARLPRQLLLLGLTGLVVVGVVLSLPLAESTRNQLLVLIGLVLTAVIALSSTTFVANAMAGLMLRTVESFRPGDFIRVGEHFGRVTERGLFHTEIQTEDRDLTTLPNLFLVSNPVSVVRSSGTVVSTTLSLGYDVAHGTVESLLLQAAERAGLEEPFVQVVSLGDYAVSYRIAGFLRDVKRMITTRSSLQRMVLDALHAARVEIVSPAFMNQRQLPPEARIIPAAAASTRPHASPPAQRPPEEMVFDKAEMAEQLESLRGASQDLREQIKETEGRLAEAEARARPQIERELSLRKAQLLAVEKLLADHNTRLEKRA